VGGVFDFALRAVGGADDADRITAVALNFEVEAKRGVSDGYLICDKSRLSQLQINICMATNEMKNGCRFSIDEPSHEN
jgi:hypothetical protein